MIITKIHEALLPLVPRQIKQNKGDELHKALSFLTVSFIALAFAIGFSITYETMGYSEIAIYCWVGSAITAASIVNLWITKNSNISNHIMTFGGFVILVFGSLVAGGVDAPGIHWFVSAQLLCVLMFQGWAQFVWPFMFSFGALFLAYSEYFGVPQKNFLTPEQNNELGLYSVFGSTFLMVAVALIYKRQQRIMLDQILKHEKELAEALEDNSRLVRIMSHDILNSLVLVNASYKSLRGASFQPLSEAMEPHLKRIEKGSHNIKLLVDHVREQQALISGKKHLQLKSVNLKKLLEDAMALLEPQILEKNLKFDFKFQSSLETDFEALCEAVSCSTIVFANLLTNAIKFSHSGQSIQIDLRFDSNNVFVDIKDSGVGIPQDLLKQLFDITSKTSRTGTSGEKGTGFGMPLVKAYMEKFGGQIEVESKVATTSDAVSGTCMKLTFKK